VLRKVFGPKRDRIREGVEKTLLLSKCYSGDQIKKNEVGGEAGNYGGDERCIESFGGET
jgi:hypothetical protein